jgi:hypothetical protein
MIMKLIRIMIYKQNLIIKTLGKNGEKKIEIFCQLGFSSKIKVPQLGSARNLHSSARLEPENSSSGSSLVVTY